MSRIELTESAIEGRMQEVERDSRLRIAIDLDDVLGDAAKSAVEYFNQRYETNLDSQMLETLDYWQEWGITRREAVDVFQQFLSERSLFIEPFSEAQNSIQRLGQEYELFVVTARPLTSREDTEDWLEQNYPGSFHEVMFTNQLSNSAERITKAKACQQIGAGVLIDDLPQHAIECSELDIPTVLLDRPWNRLTLPRTAIRVSGWLEAEKEIARIDTTLASE